jgi:hypothetical protein
MDRDKKIDRIVRGWEARGFQPGLDSEEMRGIAAIALDAAEGPEEWVPGETIPAELNHVYDDRQIQWVRQVDGDGDATDEWTATLRHTELQDHVGTVYERPVEVADRTHGAQVDGQARAYLQVLAHTADVLDAATEALAKTGQTYRQKRGFTAGLCRTAEGQAEETAHASTIIKELLKEAERQS